MFSESMESYGLYEDLSLFNGDLLLEDVNEPAVVGGQGTPSKAQDGWFSTTTPIIEEVPTNKAYVHSTLAHPQNGSNELGLADLLAASPTQDLPDPFTIGSAWLDTKTDLLDLLTAVEQQQAPVVDDALSEQQPQSVVPDMLLYPGSPEFAIVPQVPVEVSNDAASLEVIQDLLGYLPMDTTDTGTVAVVEWPPSNADIDILEELNEAGLQALLSSSAEGVSAVASSSMIDDPILSPVSADEVDSLLSSCPPSPSDSTDLASLFSSFTDESFTNSSFTLEKVEDSISEVSPQRPQREKVRSAPYPQSSSTPSSSSGGRKQKVDRRERKKEQNRTAALRYREKKRTEGDVFLSECDQLESKNSELRAKVDSMTREIKYLKDLMADVAKARVKSKKLKSGGAS